MLLVELACAMVNDGALVIANFLFSPNTGGLIYLSITEAIQRFR